MIDTFALGPRAFRLGLMCFVVCAAFEAVVVQRALADIHAPVAFWPDALALIGTARFTAYAQLGVWILLCLMRSSRLSSTEVTSRVGGARRMLAAEQVASLKSATILTLIAAGTAVAGSSAIQLAKAQSLEGNASAFSDGAAAAFTRLGVSVPLACSEILVQSIVGLLAVQTLLTGVLVATGREFPSVVLGAMIWVVAVGQANGFVPSDGMLSVSNYLNASTAAQSGVPFYITMPLALAVIAVVAGLVAVIKRSRVQ